MHTTLSGWSREPASSSTNVAPSSPPPPPSVALGCPPFLRGEFVLAAIAEWRRALVSASSFLPDLLTVADADAEWSGAAACAMRPVVGLVAVAAARALCVVGCWFATVDVDRTLNTSGQEFRGSGAQGTSEPTVKYDNEASVLLANATISTRSRRASNIGERWNVRSCGARESYYLSDDDSLSAGPRENSKCNKAVLQRNNRRVQCEYRKNAGYVLYERDLVEGGIVWRNRISNYRIIFIM